MSFVFPVLLGGLVLAGVPILIHLIMRQKPKTLPFPAFRFLVLKHRTNVRKLRLRHLLLLALRMLLLAALCLALARPRFFHQSLSLSSERPVAAVFVFDTSMSMDYRTSDKLSRLDEAKKRGLEFLQELPDGSRVLVLETSDGPVSARGDWLLNLNQARDRIKGLKLRPGSVSVLQTLEAAYRYLGELARQRDDEVARFLPRFVCVFTDRTRAAWDPARLTAAQTAADQVPPRLEGLQQARGRIPSVVELLKDLRRQLPPPPGRDYPEQALVAELDELASHVPGLTKADFPLEAKLAALVESIQRRGRDLLSALRPPDTIAPDPASKEAEDYRKRLVTALGELLQDLRGAQGLLIDVGIDEPVDLAITQVEFPRLSDGQPLQAFSEEDKFILRAVVQATGKDVSTMLRVQLDKAEFKREVSLKAGQQDSLPFEIDCAKLGPGVHQATIGLATSDLLLFNNKRFATFLVREPRKVLVIADNAAPAEFFLRALRALGYAADLKTPADATAADVARYQALYLFQVRSPTPDLWNFLASCVRQGLGVGVVPGGEEIEQAAYNQEAAQRILPGTLAEPRRHGKDDGKTPGAIWDLSDKYLQHPLVSPFRNWKEYDVVKYPSEAFVFWNVKPADKEALVIIPYRGPKDAPALLERRPSLGKGRGKVLLCTTPLDDRTPRWHNYLEQKTSFFVVLVGLCTNYLAGETEEPKMNFLSGREQPLVSLPPNSRDAAVLVVGPGVLEQMPAPDGPLRIKQADAPGNYRVEGVQPEGGNKQLTGFSVNVPADESDLTRVPVVDVELLLGSGAVVPRDRQAAIRDLLRGHWNEPLDLFPFLMAGLLLVLALENLLANKFYRSESQAADEKGSTTS